MVSILAGMVKTGQPVADLVLPISTGRKVIVFFFEIGLFVVDRRGGFDVDSVKWGRGIDRKYSSMPPESAADKISF